MAPQKIMIIAGENSGDALAAPLMQELKKTHQNIEFIGVGGKLMQKAGLKSIFPMEELSLMGIWEVLPHIPHLFKRANQLIKIAQQQNISALITIDSPDFNLRLAKKIKAKLNIPCIHYVAPSVWAWRPKRAKNMAGYTDHVLALLPFEPAYFTKVGLPCTFIGHPVMERLGKYAPTKTEMPNQPILALLPGSRAGEITRHWPAMLTVFKQLKAEIPNLTGLFPLPENAKIPKNIPKNITVIQGEKRFAALQKCTAAIAKSGTGNLELAVLGVPMVVGYKMSALTYFLAKFMVNVPYISLVNWVAGKKIVPELIQTDFTPKQIIFYLNPLLQSRKSWNYQSENLAKIRQKLANKTPSKHAAKIISRYLK